MRRFSFAVLFAVVVCGCQTSFPDDACLINGDPTCGDGSDARILKLPSTPEGSDLTAQYSDQSYSYDVSSFQANAESIIAQQETFTATIDQDPMLTPTSLHTKSTPISQDPWVTFTQDVSYGKRVGGCVGNRVTDVKRSTRLIETLVVNGVKKTTVLLDIHVATYKDQYGRRCFAVYNSGVDSGGSGGFCTCDDHHPPSSQTQYAVHQAMTNEVNVQQAAAAGFTAGALTSGIIYVFKSIADAGIGAILYAAPAL